MLKVGLPVNAAKRLTDNLRCLLGNDRSPDRFKLLQWMSSSKKSKSEVNRFILSIIHRLTRFLILIPIKSNETAVVVHHLIDRVLWVLSRT